MNDDELITTEQLARETNTPASRWHKGRLTGDSPPYIKLSHLVRYRRGDVRDWLAARKIENTSQTVVA